MSKSFLVLFLKQELLALPTSRRIAEIEALRGVAILMVLVEHMPLNLFHWLSWFYGQMLHDWRGAAGVDLFFAISGFVITRSLAAELLAAPPAARRRVVMAFWLRRFWRLAPAAWLWVALPMAFSLLLNRSGAFHGTRENAAPAAAALLNVANIYMGLCWPAHIAGITSPYWSLSLEEQFYFLFPFAVLLLRRRLIWLMLGLIAYQFFLSHSVLANMTRPGAIAAGVAIGLLAEPVSYVTIAPRVMAWPHWPRALLLLGWVALSGGLLGDRFDGFEGLRWGMEALLCGGLVFAASFDRGYVLGDGIARRAFIWVGARSYSLYLVHLPMFALAREIAFRTGLPIYRHDLQAVVMLLALALPMVGLAAVATYHWVELPSRAYGRRIAKRKEAVLF